MTFDFSLLVALLIDAIFIASIFQLQIFYFVQLKSIIWYKNLML